MTLAQWRIFAKMAIAASVTQRRRALLAAVRGIISIKFEAPIIRKPRACNRRQPEVEYNRKPEMEESGVGCASKLSRR